MSMLQSHRICEYVTLYGKRVFADMSSGLDLEVLRLFWIIWVCPIS